MADNVSDEALKVNERGNARAQSLRKNSLSDFSSDGCSIGEMHEKSDAQLLREYAGSGDESAFREIVERHADLIYSSALRQMASPDLARDVAQSVFIDLARKASLVSKSLDENVSLLGWLYRGTRFAALNQLRDERRRHARERLVMEQFNPASETAPDWERVAPILDEAMADLSDEDREALLLRFFKKQDFRAIGTALGVSDDAAQKRVSRAVERLREYFSKRNVTIGASGLAVAISANAVQAAPIGFALTISSALTGTTLASATTATTIKTIAMTTLQKSLITAVVVAAVGAGIYQAREASTLRREVASLKQQQQNAPANQLRQLTNERDNALRQLADLREENQRLNRNTRELLKLRGEMGVLRQQQASQLNQEKTESELIKSIVYFGDAEQIKKWQALGANGIQMLIQALQSTTYDHSTRMSVASLINQLKNDAKSAIQDLISLLKTEKDDGVRALMLGYFEGSMDELREKEKSEMFPDLVRDLRSSDSGVRNNALVLLQSYHRQSDVLIPLMVKSLQDSNSQVRMMAVKALNEVDPQNSADIEPVKVLVGCLSNSPDETSGAANEAVIMLGKLHREPELAVPALIQSLQSADRYIRQNSAVALASFGKQAKTAIPALTKALEDSDSDVRTHAAATIARINSAVPAN